MDNIIVREDKDRLQLILSFVGGGLVHYLDKVTELLELESLGDLKLENIQLGNVGTQS